MLDAFVVRVLLRHVAFAVDAVRETNPGQVVDTRVFETKRTRSPARRRCCGRLRMLTAPARSLGPGRRAAGRAESPCPCSSALVDGRHDGAITQHGRLQRHGNADLGRETRSGSGLEVSVDAP